MQAVQTRGKHLYHWLQKVTCTVRSTVSPAWVNGNGPLRSRPVQGDPQQEAPPPARGDTAAFRPPSSRPLAEMTQFETRGGRILLFEPESLDTWIGRRIEKDHDTGRYLDLSTGKPLSKKDAKSFEAYHARCLRGADWGTKWTATSAW